MTELVACCNIILSPVAGGGIWRITDPPAPSTPAVLPASSTSEINRAFLVLGRIVVAGLVAATGGRSNSPLLDIIVDGGGVGWIAHSPASPTPAILPAVATSQINIALLGGFGSTQHDAHALRIVLADLAAALW